MSRLSDLQDKISNMTPEDIQKLCIKVKKSVNTNTKTTKTADKVSE